MPDAPVNPVPINSNHLPGSQGNGPLGPSFPRLQKPQEPDWGYYFWNTLLGGLPSGHLFENPYFPETDRVKGGWQKLFEGLFKPPRERVDGVTGKRGDYIITPNEALNRHGIETARRLLSESPEHFGESTGRTFFCFLEMAYSQTPDWAIIHRKDGPVAIGDDLTLYRPGTTVTMMATVAGPVLELHPLEIRLWEAASLKLHRGFDVIEVEGNESDSNNQSEF